MKSLERRVMSLEQKSGIDVPLVHSIIRTFVEPSPSGPRDTGRGFATILAGPSKGLRIDRVPGEAKETFEQRVKAAADQT